LKSPTIGRVAACILTLGLSSLVGCDRPAGDSPLSSPPTAITPRTIPSMPDAAASTPMPSVFGARL
jgi:hypothetical protein